MTVAAEQAKERGNKQYTAGNYTEAVACFSEAIALDKENSGGSLHVYHSNRSASYLNLGDVSKALTDAEKCVELNPDWSKGYSRKGAALYRLGRKKEAISTYQEGLTKDPSNKAIQEALATAVKESGVFHTKKNSSYSTFGNSNFSLKSFLIGDRSAMFRTFLNGLRLLIVFNFLGYWIPAQSPRMYNAFYGGVFKFATLCYASILANTHGLPKWNQQYAIGIVQDVTIHYLFYSIIFWLAIPYTLALFPIILVEGVQFGGYLSIVLQNIAPGILSFISQFTGRVMPKLTGEVRWNDLTSERKWRILNDKLPKLCAKLQVVIGVAMLLELLTPFRNIPLTFIYWNFLRVRYMLSFEIQDSFGTLNQFILKWTNHPSCPSFLRIIYSKIQAFSAYMVKIPEPGQQPTPKCSVM